MFGFLGAPGSNKSTLSQRIAKKYEGFVHISMGDLFRRKVMQNQDDELWSRIGRKMDKGELIPMVCVRVFQVNSNRDDLENSA